MLLWSGRWSRPIAILLVAVSSGACYTYTPMDLEAIPPQSEVRAYVTVAGAASLEEAGVEVREDEGRAVRASLLELDGSSIRLRIPVSMRQVGFHSTPINQEMVLPADQIRLIEHRQLDRTASALVAIGGAALVAGVAYAIVGEARRRPGDRPPPMDVNEALIPLGSFRW